MIVSSRRFLLRTGLAVVLSVGGSGCIDPGRSETERRAIAAYERAFGNHASGLGLLETGFGQVDAETYRPAAESFAAAVDEFDAAARALREARAKAIEESSTDAVAFVDSASRPVARARAGAQRVSEAATSLQNGTDRRARRTIERTRERFRTGEYRMPPAGEFEAAL